MNTPDNTDATAGKGMQQDHGQRYAMGVAYQGNGFNGWERQLAGRTVQDVLQQALSTIAATEIKVICAGRTDAGVHALGQVVHFDSGANRTTDSWVYGVNSLLPSDVAVQWAKPVADDFHARFSARMRHYRYLLLNRRSRCPLSASSAAWEPRLLEVEAMQVAARALLGYHDFSSFRSSGCQAANPHRTIHDLQLYRHQDMLVIEIAADAFLQKMVRNMVGTLLQVGLKRQSPSWVATVLAARDRKMAGATASATGLYLLKVCYPSEYDIPLPEPQLIALPDVQQQQK